MLIAATRGQYTGPLYDAELARRSNRHLGTQLAPWDIGQLDLASIDLLETLLQGLPQVRAAVAEVDKAKEAYRKSLRVH